MSSAYVTVDWYGDRVSAKVQDAAADGLFLATKQLMENVQVTISVVGPPHSLPGEAPHLITGELQGSARMLVSRGKLESYVFMEAPYAVDLEFGTSIMAPRPFLFRTLAESKEEILQIIVATIKKRVGRDVSASAVLGR